MEVVKIYTIHSYNYGNRLQNYATQMILENMGYKILTIQDENQNEKIELFFLKYPFLGNTKYVIKILKKGKMFIRDIIKRDSYTRYHKFDKYIHYSDEYITSHSYKVQEGKALIVGSDQIWNTSFPFITVNSFLPFPYKKKIAFAASFGVDSIQYDSKIVECLNDFNALSVRENSGAEIIKKLTGKDATVIVDPTMLLDRTEWRKISKKPISISEGYVLTYFLSPKCGEAKIVVEKLKKENRILHEIMDPKDKTVNTAGPAEFIWLIEHADLILTDSFHACVFSFLFNKPFIVFDRNWNEGNMNSRLKTFLTMFSLERKYCNSGIPNDIWEHDYSLGYKQLDKEKIKSKTFLERALAD